MTQHEGIPAPYPGPGARVDNNNIFDEIVINQEQQVIPSFILTFKAKNLLQLVQQYHSDAQLLKNPKSNSLQSKFNPQDPTGERFLQFTNSNSLTSLNVLSTSSEEDDLISDTAMTVLLQSPNDRLTDAL